jgi:hypothetical protein
MKQKDAINRSNRSLTSFVESYEGSRNERLISRLIYGIVLFAFFYFGMGTILFVFFR